jgi:hypothetical protein
MVNYAVHGPVELCHGERRVAIGDPRQVGLLPSLSVSHPHDAVAGWLELYSAGRASLDEAVSATKLRPALELAPIVAVANLDDAGPLAWWTTAARSRCSPSTRRAC